MSSISSTSFGSLQIENGTPTLSTQVFGVDIGNLVDGLVEAKRIPVLQLEDRIETNDSEITALTDLKSLTQDLANTLTNLRNPTLSMGGTNVFGQKVAIAESSNGVNPSNLLAITPGADAPEGTFDLTVNRVATQDIVNSSVGFTSPDDTPLNFSSNIYVNGERIRLTTAMTTQNIVDEINAVSADSGVTAQLILAGENDYRISLQADETGNAMSFALSNTFLLADLGLAESGETDTSPKASSQQNR